MNYRLVIFDFDGTLADSGQWLLGALNQLADEFGFERIDPREHNEFRNLGAMDVLRRLNAPLWKLPRMMARVREWAARDADRIPLFSGVHELLDALDANGKMLAVVSSNAEQNIRRVLGAGASQRISHYRCGASLLGKRSRLRRLLKETGISPLEAIYIGDEIRDIHAARGAGVSFGGVSWGYNTLDALKAHAPDLVFESVPEIAEKL